MKKNLGKKSSKKESGTIGVLIISAQECTMDYILHILPRSMTNGNISVTRRSRIKNQKSSLQGTIINSGEVSNLNKTNLWFFKLVATGNHGLDVKIEGPSLRCYFNLINNRCFE